MKKSDYEYTPSDESIKITEERRQILIKKMKDIISKGYIPLHDVLEVGENDAEYDFMYKWLEDNQIIIRGINSTLSGEIPNYEHIPRVGKNCLPKGLTSEQIKDYLNRIKLGDTEARKELITHHMKLAIKVANSRKIMRLNIPTDDRNQIAMLGLIRAVDKFGDKNSSGFQAYASKAIYFHIFREWYKENSEAKYLIRRVEFLEQLEEFENKFQIKNGRMPTNEEIASGLKLTLERVSKIQSWRRLRESESLDEIQDTRAKESHIDSCLSDTARVSYYGEGYAIDNDGSYIEPPEDKLTGREIGKFDTEFEVFQREAQRDIRDVLLSPKITGRERKVLRLRFESELSRTETAKIFKVTSERIRQIEFDVLKRIRINRRYTRKLRDYIDNMWDYSAQLDSDVITFGEDAQDVKADRLRKEQEAMALIKLNQKLNAQIAEVKKSDNER